MESAARGGGRRERRGCTRPFNENYVYVVQAEFDGNGEEHADMREKQ